MKADLPEASDAAIERMAEKAISELSPEGKEEERLYRKLGLGVTDPEVVELAVEDSNKHGST